MAHSPGFQRLRRLFAVAGWARRNRIPPHQAEAAFERHAISRRAMLEILDDLAMAPAALHIQAIRGKLAIEQACYHGDRLAAVRWA